MKRVTCALLSLMFSIIFTTTALAGPPPPGLDVAVVGCSPCTGGQTGEVRVSVTNATSESRQAFVIALLHAPDGVRALALHGAFVAFPKGTTVVPSFGSFTIGAARGVTLVEVALLDPVTGATLAREFRGVGAQP